MLSKQTRKLKHQLFAILNTCASLNAYTSRVNRSTDYIEVKATGVPTDVHRRASFKCTLEPTAFTHPTLNTCPGGWVAHEHLAEWGPGITDYLERLVAGACHRGFALHGFCHEHTHTRLTLWADWDDQWWTLTVELMHED